ncbi:hypothetical protein RJV04_005118 [Salmonella enterica]|nr:hypothetical protein [Salmonella enterica]
MKLLNIQHWQSEIIKRKTEPDRLKKRELSRLTTQTDNTGTGPDGTAAQQRAVFSVQWIIGVLTSVISGKSVNGCR